MGKKIAVNQNVVFSDRDTPLVLIAGPCVIENYDKTFYIAEKIKEITDDLQIPFVFKASFDKANRSSIESYRGPGLDAGLEILAAVKEELAITIITDIHLPFQAEKVGEVVDIIQIPAFLSRQTDLLIAAAETGKLINIKKGQFLAPADMNQVVSKIESTGNKKILLTERGTSFGYHNLVVDMTSLVIMKETGYPVIFDGTHSVQLPGAAGETSGGNREYVFPLIRAAVATGIDGLFLEVHDRPEEALCDGPNMVRLKDLAGILKVILKIDKLVKKEGF